MNRAKHHKELTTREVAILAGVSMRSVAKAIAGTSVGLATLEKIAAALEVVLPERVRRSAGRPLIMHGLSKNDENKYLVYAFHHMHARCTDESHPDYFYYGARGISVCKRWSKSEQGLKNFIADLGRRPTPQHSLHRIRPTGNYGPSNCIWADKLTQSRQKSNLATLVVNEQLMTCDQAVNQMVQDGVAIKYIVDARGVVKQYKPRKRRPA